MIGGGKQLVIFSQYLLPAEQLRSLGNSPRKYVPSKSFQWHTICDEPVLILRKVLLFINDPTRFLSRKNSQIWNKHYNCWFPWQKIASKISLSKAINLFQLIVSASKPSKNQIELEYKLLYTNNSSFSKIHKIISLYNWWMFNSNVSLRSLCGKGFFNLSTNNNI